jgi:hypothetical protein
VSSRSLERDMEQLARENEEFVSENTRYKFSTKVSANFIFTFLPGRLKLTLMKENYITINLFTKTLFLTMHIKN